MNTPHHKPVNVKLTPARRLRSYGALVLERADTTNGYRPERLMERWRGRLPMIGDPHPRQGLDLWELQTAMIYAGGSDATPVR
jgi:hypothetical protein